MTGASYEQSGISGLLDVNTIGGDSKVHYLRPSQGTSTYTFEPSDLPTEKMTDLTRQEVDAKLAQNKAEVEARLANFDTSIKSGFADLRAEFAELRAEMAKQASDTRVEMANVRSDTQKSAAEITRWVVGFGIAILGVMFTLSKVSDKPAAAPVAQPTPIIITVPAGATVAPSAALQAQSPAPAAKK